MSSNNYNPYNYPYQQSSAQQYSGYQTATAANNASQPSRQYQQPGPAVTTQAADYISYPAQNYTGQSSTYSGGHANSWTANNYGANRETTSRAAEVLRNMSNTSYAPSTTAAVSQSGFTATNSATTNSSRYSTGAVQAQQVQPPQHTHVTYSAYGTSQARPRSVSTNTAPVVAPSRGLPSPVMAAGYPSQRSQTNYNQQRQRSASPVQNAYTHRTTTPVSTTGNATTAASNQYNNNYNNRQLPIVEATRSTKGAVIPASYSYAEPQVPAPVVQPIPTANISEQYSQNAVTVDPMAVYDPWPEYQRKQEALRAQKAVEDAARAEEERKAEEIHLEEKRKEEEKRTRLEEEERARNPVPVALPVSQPKSKNVQVSKKAQKQQATVTEATSSNPKPSQDHAAKLEAEIRAMMAKMRELNNKDPALLARIWEEERRSKVPKSPTAQSKPVAQPAVAQPVRANVPQATDQRETSAAKEAYNAASARALLVAVAQPSVTKPQAQAAASSARPAGNTIWPPEKKSQLANAAATYLTARNPSKPIDADKVLSMLDSNPSYIELCEQLENMGLKLDRAAFAKNLLTAVPDVNSASRQYAPRLQTKSAIARRVQAPLAIPAKKVATPGAPNPQYPSAAFPIDRRSFPPFPDNNASASHSPAPVAEMVPIRAELKPPCNKEEAARKRNFNDLIDLTLLDDDEDNQPPLKKQNVNSIYSSHDSPNPMLANMDIDKGRPQVNNFPVPASVPQAAPVSAPAPQHAPSALRHTNLVLPLDKYKALRRSTYNIKTIARDVLLACGRHPDERQLNAHLDILRINLPQINTDADLSTVRWDLIDPGEPPRGYFKIGVQGAEAEDADNESSDDEDAGARMHAPAQAIGGEATEARVQALPEASNPFKPKRRGRPPRHSFPSTSTTAETTAETPHRVSSNANMSASAPRPSAASVGYSAFRSATEYGPDGNPLPKKKGRPVGWRKAIHGSPTAQARPSANGHTGPVVNQFVPSQPSTLRNVRTGKDEPIIVQSRSPSVVNKVPRYQSFKCKWQNCKAELHNLETLKKHVHKIHHKETLRGTLECLWGDCGREVTSVDQRTNMTIKKHTPFTFTEDSTWREHLNDKHFSPILWELGDGPVGGLSGESRPHMLDVLFTNRTKQMHMIPKRILVTRKDVKSLRGSLSLLRVILATRTR
jgi:hypothetical protein